MDPAPIFCTVFPPERPLVATVPHSGEWIPPEAPWLNGLPLEVLLLDVDRFVDELYTPAFTQTQTSWVATRVHRYAADLNRLPEDVDAATVQGAEAPAGTYAKGFHWAKSTQDHAILTEPLSPGAHLVLVRRYHDPFHDTFERVLAPLRGQFQAVYHLDCHSMPSQGTAAHADAGKSRPDVVISDFEGKSSRPDFVEAIVNAFRDQGLQVSVNWPYKGGRLTQRYGQPAHGHHTVQIELNRALYLDEKTRARLPVRFEGLQKSLGTVLTQVGAFVDSIAERNSAS